MPANPTAEATVPDQRVRDAQAAVLAIRLGGMFVAFIDATEE